jgi:hypothetical protein
MSRTNKNLKQVLDCYANFLRKCRRQVTLHIKG